MKKIIFKFIRISILVFVVVICSSNNGLLEAKVNNNNLNKTVDVSTMALKISEFNYDALYGAKDTITGDLTGYVYNCPACTGHLACMSNYNIKDGTITYPDEEYGIVNIVASSINLPCGTIIRFSSSRISDTPIYAVVLDRGVLGNAIDFLSYNEEYAISQVGRSTITYDVLRFGW